MRLRPDPRYGDLVVRGVLVVLLVVSLGLLGSVIVLRGEMPALYNGISNATQLVAGTAAAGVAAWVYLRRTPDMLLAHGAFAGATWTLANAFWYAYFILIGEGLNYPTVADLGFAGVFLFLISGYQVGLVRSSLPAWYVAPVVVLPAAGFGLIFLLGANAKTLTTLVIFILAAVLVSEALLRPAHRHPALLAATLVFVLAHLLNSLRSTLPDPLWVVSATGALAAISFSLFALAYLGYTREGTA